MKGFSGCNLMALMSNSLAAKAFFNASIFYLFYRAPRGAWFYSVAKIAELIGITKQTE